MRIALSGTAAAIIAMASVSCGGDSNASPAKSAPAVASVAASASAVRTQAAATPASRATSAPAVSSQVTGDTVEVTGIVDGVSLTGNIIEIRRLQGAAVTRVGVGPGTVVRKAAGGTLAFRDIRTSDRIIARGTLNDRRDTLLASQITVQDVIPGAQPGG